MKRLLILVLLSGCGVTGLVRDDHLPDLAGTVGVLRIGTEGYCSAVLVSEDRILTAAHCFMFSSGGSLDKPTNQLTFELGPSKRRLTFWHSLGAGLNGHDMAIAGLDNRIEGIPPADVDENDPRRGDPLMYAGYGCRSGDHMACIVAPSMTVRHVDTPPAFTRYGFESGTFKLYPGDSGGALFNLKTGKIIGLGSAYSWPSMSYFSDTRTLFGML